MEQVNLNDTFDAKVWAQEFMKTITEKKLVVDEDLMLAWFANAIMAGHDHAYRKKSKFERSELLSRLGAIYCLPAHAKKEFDSQLMIDIADMLTN